MASSSSSPEVSETRDRPGASFVSDVQTYLTQPGLDVTSSLAFLQERLQQYKVVQMKLLAQQRELQAKIPDIEKFLDIVSEGIYSRACIEELDSVCLWLGANVMLEYRREEASALLQKNLDKGEANYCNCCDRLVKAFYYCMDFSAFPSYPSQMLLIFRVRDWY
ncbi:hypothetical protein MKW92_016301 [Papaver armeniacum]|nr:hypothetical protein MKW92_016301 [Papaver armeniacum]